MGTAVSPTTAPDRPRRAGFFTRLGLDTAPPGPGKFVGTAFLRAVCPYDALRGRLLAVTA